MKAAWLAAVLELAAASRVTEISSSIIGLPPISTAMSKDSRTPALGWSSQGNFKRSRKRPLSSGRRSPSRSFHAKLRSARAYSSGEVLSSISLRATSRADKGSSEGKRSSRARRKDGTCSIMPSGPTTKDSPVGASSPDSRNARMAAAAASSSSSESRLMSSRSWRKISRACPGSVLAANASWARRMSTEISAAGVAVIPGGRTTAALPASSSRGRDGCRAAFCSDGDSR